MFQAHGLPVAHRKARCVQKFHIQMEKRFEQIGNGIGRITVIAIERHDDVAGCRREAGFITAPVAPHVLADHFRAESSRDFRGAVGRAVIDDNHFIDELRHAPQYQFNPLFFVQTWNDYSDFLTLVHSAASLFGCYQWVSWIHEVVPSTGGECYDSARFQSRAHQMLRRFISSRCPMVSINIWQSGSPTESTVQVVTDPQKADAILTDRIGAGFEQKLDDLYRVQAQERLERSERLSGMQEDNARPVMRRCRAAKAQFSSLIARPATSSGAPTRFRRARLRTI